MVALGLEAGDLVVVDPGGVPGAALLRPLSCSAEAVVGLLGDGGAEFVTPPAKVAVSVAPRAAGDGLARPAEPTVRLPHLSRVK